MKRPQENHPSGFLQGKIHTVHSQHPEGHSLLSTSKFRNTHPLSSWLVRSLFVVWTILVGERKFYFAPCLKWKLYTTTGHVGKVSRGLKQMKGTCGTLFLRALLFLHANCLVWGEHGLSLCLLSGPTEVVVFLFVSTMSCRRGIDHSRAGHSFGGSEELLAWKRCLRAVTSVWVLCPKKFPGVIGLGKAKRLVSFWCSLEQPSSTQKSGGWFPSGAPLWSNPAQPKSLQPRLAPASGRIPQ